MLQQRVTRTAAKRVGSPGEIPRALLLRAGSDHACGWCRRYRFSFVGGVLTLPAEKPVTPPREAPRSGLGHHRGGRSAAVLGVGARSATGPRERGSRFAGLSWGPPARSMVAPCRASLATPR